AGRKEDIREDRQQPAPAGRVHLAGGGHDGDGGGPKDWNSEDSVVAVRGSRMLSPSRLPANISFRSGTFPRHSVHTSLRRAVSRQSSAPLHPARCFVAAASRL